MLDWESFLKKESQKIIADFKDKKKVRVRETGDL